MLQVHLEQVGHPALPPEGDEQVYLLRRHVLAGILPRVEEPEQRAEYGAVHPRAWRGSWRPAAGP